MWDQIHSTWQVGWSWVNSLPVVQNVCSWMTKTLQEWEVLMAICAQSINYAFKIIGAWSIQWLLEILMNLCDVMIRKFSCCTCSSVDIYSWFTACWDRRLLPLMFPGTCSNPKLWLSFGLPASQFLVAFSFIDHSQRIISCLTLVF